MPTINKTWKSKRDFAPGVHELGSEVLPPAVGSATISIDRSTIPANHKLKVRIETRNVGESVWNPDVAIEIDNTGGLTPNKGGGFISTVTTQFNRAVNWEVRAEAEVIGADPFSFDAKINAQWS